MILRKEKEYCLSIYTLKNAIITGRKGRGAQKGKKVAGEGCGREKRFFESLGNTDVKGTKIHYLWKGETTQGVCSPGQTNTR